MEGALLAKFGFETLLRPSRASLKSVTPTPRVERARLCNDILSIFIKVGATLMSGERPSPRKVSYADLPSTASIGVSLVSVR